MAQSLDLAKWNRIADEGAARLETLLAGVGKKAAGITARVRQRLGEHRENNRVSLAFVGAYSAGKSTIISALTGRDDIPIRADITTDRCTAYEWRGIRLVDTPGLYTERQEHDEITTSEIERSDLLAFCLTVHLFDPVTLQEFRELAETSRYAPKMLLVVNKLLTDVGDADARIERYRADLREMLGSSLLRTIPLVFTDAKVYRDAIAGGSAKLEAKSRFGDVIQALNRLTDERALLGRADTPFRIVIGGVNDAIDELSSGETNDKTFLHLWRRCMDIFMARRREIHRTFANAAQRAVRAVIHAGDGLLDAIDGSADAFADAERQSIQRLQEQLEDIDGSLKKTLLDIGERLHAELEDVRALPLFQAFIRSVKTKTGIEAAGAPARKQSARAEKQLGILQNLVTGLDGILSTPSHRAVTRAAAPSVRPIYNNVFAKSRALPPMTETARGVAPLTTTSFDEILRGTVDHLNAKFGWHLTSNAAIDASHHLGQFLHALGPVLALGSVASSAFAMYGEQKRAEILGGLRLKLQERYAAVRDEMKQKFAVYGDAFDRDVLQPIETELRSKRDAAEKAISSDNKLVEQLRSLRDELENALRELASSAT